MHSYKYAVLSSSTCSGLTPRGTIIPYDSQTAQCTLLEVYAMHVLREPYTACAKPTQFKWGLISSDVQKTYNANDVQSIQPLSQL